MSQSNQITPRIKYGRFFELHLFCLSLTLLAVFIGFTTFDIGVFSPLFAALALYSFSLAISLETLLGLVYLGKLARRNFVRA